MGSGWLRCSGGRRASFINQPHGGWPGDRFPPGTQKNWTPVPTVNRSKIVAQYAVAVKKDFPDHSDLFKNSVIFEDGKSLVSNAAKSPVLDGAFDGVFAAASVRSLSWRTGQSLKSFPNDSLKGIILGPLPRGFWLPPAHGRGARS